MYIDAQTKEFRANLAALPRQEILELIEIQDPQLVVEVNRIEYVFKNKLSHLHWPDGSKVDGRPVTNDELALLVDPPFQIDDDLLAAGISAQDQRKLHHMKDPVMWAKDFLNIDGHPVRPRAYQIMIMRHENKRKVLRAGRRLGKTFSLAMLLLHYAWTNSKAKCLVIAPMKEHVGLIYNAMLDLLEDSDVVKQSLGRHVTSPQYSMEFNNGSTIKFFTSGMRSGGKTDVARGQEAHLIVLDEMDYMHPEDLDAIYVMLQQTSEGQVEKELMASSTPTGRKEKFYDWAVNNDRFKEFWFPSYCNPFFDKETENEFREEYTDMVYRHEVEADWGEDTYGVYPPRLVDPACHITEPWDYLEVPYDVLSDPRSFTVMGVDWDKYGAGVNIVILEICSPHYGIPALRSRLRLLYREETKKEEFTLLNGLERVKQLNNVFKPKHIYIDRGYGETQSEALRKFGIDNPTTRLHIKVKGVAFNESVEMKDPYTGQVIKKEVKDFMVSNLRNTLEGNILALSSYDDLLYNQLTSYIVARKTHTGKPVYEAAGKYGDHAHDALALAVHAYVENYGDLMHVEFANHARTISGEKFAPLYDLDDVKPDSTNNSERLVGTSDQNNVPPARVRRAMTLNRGRKKAYRPISRKSV